MHEQVNEHGDEGDMIEKQRSPSSQKILILQHRYGNDGFFSVVAFDIQKRDSADE